MLLANRFFKAIITVHVCADNAAWGIPLRMQYGQKQKKERTACCCSTGRVTETKEQRPITPALQTAQVTYRSTKDFHNGRGAKVTICNMSCWLKMPVPLESIKKHTNRQMPLPRTRIMSWRQWIKAKPHSLPLFSLSGEWSWSTAMQNIIADSLPWMPAETTCYWPIWYWTDLVGFPQNKLSQNFTLKRKLCDQGSYHKVMSTWIYLLKYQYKQKKPPQSMFGRCAFHKLLYSTNSLQFWGSWLFQ